MRTLGRKGGRLLKPMPELIPNTVENIARRHPRHAPEAEEDLRYLKEHREQE